MHAGYGRAGGKREAGLGDYLHPVGHGAHIHVHQPHAGEDCLTGADHPILCSQHHNRYHHYHHYYHHQMSLPLQLLSSIKVTVLSSLLVTLSSLPASFLVRISIYHRYHHF
jgi:hypothetical protein